MKDIDKRLVSGNCLAVMFEAERTAQPRLWVGVALVLLL